MGHALNVGNKRIEWLDFAKGVAIFLVGFGHYLEMLNATDKLIINVYIFIYSFHMPLFFMLSGMSFSDEKYSDFCKFVKNKFLRIMIPAYVFVGIDNIVFLLRNKHIDYSAKRILRTLLQFRTTNLGCYWFLPSLFCALVIMWLVHACVKGNKKRLILSFGISVLAAIYFYYVKKPLPFNLDDSCLVIVFMEIGYQIKRKTELLNSNILVIMLLMIIGGVVAIQNSKVSKQAVSLAYTNIGNPVLFFGAALLLSLVVILIAMRIKSNRLINYWGRNTLIIYLTSGYFFSVLSKLFIVGKDSNALLGLLICFIGTVIGIFLAACLSSLINKYLPFLVGKKMEKNR